MESGDHPVEADRQCLRLNFSGDFLIWNDAAVRWLRLGHRITGRPSFSCDSNVSDDLPSSNMAVTLPVRLSFEETVHLFKHDVIDGFQLRARLLDCQPPTAEQHNKYCEALETNRIQMKEIWNTRRRLRLSCKYNEILEGLSVHEERQIHKNRGSLPQSPQSKRKRAVSLDRASDNSERQLCITSQSSSHDSEDPLTLNHLLDFFHSERSDINTIPDLFNDPSPRHLPRPTPTEFLRSDESRFLRIPELVKSEGLSAIATWVFNQLHVNKDSPRAGLAQYSEAQCPELLLARCHIYSDLWARGWYVTVGATKMGGDFLIYPGDPLHYHASHIVHVVRSHDAPRSQLIASKVRLANTVRKVLVLAYCSLPTLNSESNPKILYLSVQWLGRNK